MVRKKRELTKRELTREIEREIRNLCYDSVRGRAHDIRRVDELFKWFPEQFGRISDEEVKKAREEMMGFSASFNTMFSKVHKITVTEDKSDSGGA